ncbi:MAG: ribulose-phosphate 3-epimerase [Nanoarchaeota archaeon]|nr:ribulose-phosphate 3-epimerase [Nanoarchaeota archaeon]
MVTEESRKKILVSPSILSVDFSNLEKDMLSIEQYVDMFHIDVMDGHFVPNITIGPCVVKGIRKVTRKIFDVHLMISEPEKYIKEFSDAGSDYITVHAEVKYPMLKLIHEIRKFGKKAGVSLNPDTDIGCVLPYIKELDMITVMSVFPGFSGQKFMPEVLEKVRLLDNARKVNRAKELLIEIDGGINGETAKLAVEAGADVLVSGSYIFGSRNRKKAIDELRGWGKGYLLS